MLITATPRPGTPSATSSTAWVSTISRPAVSPPMALGWRYRRWLARWTARIGLGEQVVTTKTLRRRFFSLARRLTLHLPRCWAWKAQFSDALTRLRILPLPS